MSTEKQGTIRYLCYTTLEMRQNLFWKRNSIRRLLLGNDLPDFYGPEDILSFQGLL